MNTILKVFSLLIGTSVLPAVSDAADQSVRRNLAATAAASETITWGGFYIGGHVGLSLLNAAFTDPTEFYGAVYSDANGLGMSAGVGGGFNYLIGANGLIGLEADINWSNLEAKHFLPTGASLAATTFKAETPWFTTLRGRAGVTFGSTLLYGTAGLAFAEQKQDFILRSGLGIDLACGADSTCIQKKTVGLVLGAGAEFALTKTWRLKAEYLNISLLRSDTYQITQITSSAPGEVVDFKNQIQSVRVGLNYYFQ